MPIHEMPITRSVYNDAVWYVREFTGKSITMPESGLVTDGNIVSVINDAANVYGSTFAEYQDISDYIIEDITPEIYGLLVSK